MNKRLEAFQTVGSADLAANHHHMLADAPGLGKTLQAIDAVEKIGARNILVVCPASVRSNWEKEVEECLGDSEGWQIISYNQASSGGYCRMKYDVCILDEAHFLKTNDSKRTQAIFGNGFGLARRAEYIWPLTGTPVLNRPRELYPVLACLHPHFAGMSFSKFTQRYCAAFFDGRGIDTRGASHLDELAGLLQPFMTRRTKKEAFPGRTAPLVSRVPVELTHEDLKAVNALEDEIGGREARISSVYNDFSALGDTSSLLRLLGNAKVRHVVLFVAELLQTVDRIVVFAYHREVMSALRVALAKYNPVTYQGGMSDDQKTAAISAFKFPGCRVFIGQRVAAGTGINGLQEVASTCVIAEPSWVPGETEQMIDRLDRMGQKDDLVTAYILYAARTLDAIVVKTHDRKEKVVEKLMSNPLEGL